MAHDGSDIAAFRAARDYLLAHREDYPTAYATFEWPRLTHFNWARDWFDGVLAVEHADRPAIWIIEEEQHGKPPRGVVAIDEPAVRARCEGAGLVLGSRVPVTLTVADPVRRRVMFSTASRD